MSKLMLSENVYSKSSKKNSKNLSSSKRVSFNESDLDPKTPIQEFTPYGRSVIDELQESCDENSEKQSVPKMSPLNEIKNTEIGKEALSQSKRSSIKNSPSKVRRGKDWQS